MGTSGIHIADPQDGTPADVIATAPVSDTGQAGLAVRVISQLGSGGGGAAVTVADGADVALGAVADVAWSSGSGTVIGLLKKLAGLLAGTLTVGTHPVTNAGTFAVQSASTLAAETTKVIGTVNQGTSPWVTNDPGLPDTLGQKNMAGSTGVVLASDQASIPVAATLGAETTKVIGTVNVAAAQTIGVTGTFFQATQPVSLASAPTTAVTGTFWQSTQPVSIATAPVLVAGTAAIGHFDAPTTIYNGKKTVTTAGTRVTLASSQAVRSVVIKALVANTGTIFVGDGSVASTTGLALAPGDSVSLDIANLATVNLDSSVNGEGVTYLGTN